MATGTISFVASIEGLELEELEVSFPHPSIKRLLLKTQEDGKLHIDFDLIDVYSEREAVSVVKDLIGPIVSRISYEFNCPIGDPRFASISLPTDSSGLSNRVIAEIVCLNDICSGTIKPNEDKRQKLRRTFGFPVSETDLYLSLYRFCLGQKDPLARFLSLYHLLVLIVADEDESQWRIDSAIKRIDPDVEMTVKPESKRNPKRNRKSESPKLETAYTRLRNEIVHRRLGKLLPQTKEEVKERVGGLQEIARKLISEIVKVG